MASLLVESAALVWCGDDAGTELSDASLLCTDGVISRIGAPDDAWPAPDRVLDARNCVVVPGLVNTHHHLYQTLTRAFSPALQGDLFDWLRVLYPVWARLDEESAYVSAWVGLAELLLSGCTASSDHLYVHPRGQRRLVDAEIAAARDLGIRFHATRGSMSLSEKDGGLPPDDVVEDEEAILEDSERLVGTYHDPAPGAMVRVGLAPCSPFSVSHELMSRSAALARRLGVRLHTHLAETRNELAYCAKRFGVSPYELANRVGWLGPEVWLAHAVWTTPKEMELLAKTGTALTHCPTSNMMIGAGHFPLADALNAGVTVGLGTDGSAAHDASDLWGEVRQALLLAHLRDGPASVSARDVLRLATRGSAACLGRDDIGSIELGKRADLACYPLNRLSASGAVLDPVEAIVRCAVREAEHTVVDGRVLVQNGRLTVDAEPVLRRHAEISDSWAKSAS